MDQYHDLEKQPTVLNKNLNRRLSIQNFGLNKNWSKQINDIEKQKSNHGSRLDGEINKVLRYRNSLAETTGRLSETEQLILPTISFSTDNPRRKVSSVNYPSIVDDIFLREDKNQKTNQLQKMKYARNRVDSLTKETTSFENKKIGRRKSSYSLLELKQFVSQQYSSHADGGHPKTIEEGETDQDTPKNNHLWLDEGEVLPIKLPPVAHIWKLPKIYDQAVRKVEVRNFERDDAFVQRATGKDADHSDMKFCRYLRVPQPKKGRLRSNTK
ncbi:uncharacterized protein LOC110253848 [Exaiptasia diaphana]|uniref:Uncharacterized protein n=1 Tax=Exaiptasia diaphana TaxID=2652724 RepID=A0A913Y8D4_EXADI|nr:uncharacterized protein LOC110253848 [Exaiptasia diaphana]